MKYQWMIESGLGVVNFSSIILKKFESSRKNGGLWCKDAWRLVVDIDFKNKWNVL